MSVLKGTKTFYDFGVNDQVSYNIKSRLMYGLLEMGAFTNVNYTDSYGTLKRSSAKVFEGLGAGWVWESGIQVLNSLPSPYPVSGIYFNNTFYPNGSTITSGSFSSTWYVDYRHGRVIFNSNTPAGTQIKCNYSARDVAVYLVDEPEWKIVVDNYINRFDTIDDLAPSGIAGVLKKNRVWLPCVSINLRDIENDPLQLGGGEIANCAIFYNILSDNAFSTRRLCDTILEQNETSIDLYNINIAPFPLKHNGSLNSGVVEYPSLCQRGGPYFWTYSFLEETNGGFVDSDGDLYHGQIRQIAKVYRYNSTY